MLIQNFSVSFPFRRTHGKHRIIRIDLPIAQSVKILSFAVSYWKWLRSVVPDELLIFAVFVLSHLFVTNYKPYSVLIFLYASLLVIVTKDISSSLWYATLGTLLFFKAKYFSIPFISSAAVSAGLTTETPFEYYISFSLMLLALLIFSILRTRRGASVVLPLFWESILITLLLLIGSVSSSLSAFGAVSWFSLLIVVEYVLLFYVSIIMCSDKKVFMSIRMIILFISLNALLIVLQKLRGGPIGIILEDVSSGAFGRFPTETPGFYRPGGIYFEPNLPASLINLILPAALYFVLTHIKGLVGVVLRMSLLMLLAALIATGSRANLAIGVIAISTTAWYYWHKNTLFTLFTNPRFIIIIAIVLLLLLPTIFSRVSSVPTSFTGDTGGWQFRLRHITIAKDIISTNIFGVGLDVFQYHILDHYSPTYYFSHFTAPHNVLAEVGSATGFIGLGVFISFFIVVLYRLFKNFKGDNTAASGINAALLIGYATYLLSAQVYPWLFTPPLSELSWIVLGCLYAKTAAIKK